jgi:hypothetical protein
MAHLRSCLVTVAIALTGCSRARDAQPYVATGPLARVLVDSAGAVHLNGHLIDLAALADSLRSLQTTNGAVLYSRTPFQSEPNASQSSVVHQVLKDIVALRLPVRLLHPDSLMLPDSVLRK